MNLTHHLLLLSLLLCSACQGQDPMTYDRSDIHTDFSKEPQTNDVEYFPTHHPVSSVTIVAHGLNTKPEVMQPLIDWLGQKGSDAYLLKLYGHTDKDNGFEGLEREKWEEQFQRAYQLAHSRAEELGVPLYFLGFSLGALVGQYAMFKSNGAIKIDKQVLLAPATAIRNRSYLLKALFFLPADWYVPSKTPADYRANKGTTIKAYKILFSQQKRICKGAFKHLNIPTLILIDPKDELISLPKLRKYKDKFHLSNYHIFQLDPHEAASYHHLIVDEYSMGEENWDRATRAIENHLFRD